MDAADGAPPPAAPRVPLRRLVALFAWTGLSSIGGGRYAFFYDALVARRPWVRNDEFLQDLTLAQVLPGPTFSNIAVVLGYRLGGWRGALWGGAALILPGALILLVLAALYFHGSVAPTGGGAMRAMSAAVVGLVALSAARVIAGAIRDWRGPIVAAAVFALVGPLQVNTALVVVLVIPVSVWLYRPRRAAR